MLIVTIIFSCSEKEILPEEKFINIYVDILVAQDTITDQSMSVDSLKSTVLWKYNVSDTVYAKTIEHYNNNPGKWEEFFNNAIKKVEELNAKKEE
jgi:hypothetical protein